MYCIITMHTTKPYNYKPNGDTIMKKLEPLRNLKLTAGRYLLMIFALTMLPMGTWAEGYDLTVAGVQVTSENASNITGGNITGGLVSFEASTNTLTLNGVTASGQVSSSIANLKVKIIGSSVFTLDNSSTKAPLFLYTGTEAETKTLTFIAENLGASLSVFGSSTANNSVPLSNDYNVTTQEGNYDYWKYTEGNGYDGKCCCQLSKPYLWVADEAIDDSNIGSTPSGYSFNASTNTLSLSGFQTEGTPYYLVKSNLQTLTVNVSGMNTVRLNTTKTSNQITSRVFKYTEASGSDPSLTLNIAEGASLLAQWGGESPVAEWLSEGYELVVPTDAAEMDASGPLMKLNPNSNSMTLTYVALYDLWVKSIRVNSSNHNDVLGTRTVSFAPASGGNPATLTLNGVTRNDITTAGVDAILTGISPLTIFLAGDNIISITGNGDIAFNKTEGLTTADITFTTDAQSSGSLYVDASASSLFGSGVTPTYTNLHADISDSRDNQTISSAFEIQVAGTSVTEFNKTDVLDDGKVSYNESTNTLTLNNAVIDLTSTQLPTAVSGIAYNSESDLTLTISLIGSNTIKSGNSSAIRGGEMPKLVFAKGDSEACSLLMETTGVESVINWTGDIDYGALYRLESSIPGDQQVTTYRVNLTSTLLGGGSGTSADPFLIKTADDLKNFATYINGSTILSNVSVKLNNDLDCAQLTGFEPIGTDNTPFAGTFDGNGKTISSLTMSEVSGKNVGIFRTLTENGTIKELTVASLTISGGTSSSNGIGGLVGLVSGGTVSNCTLQGANVSCLNTSQNPTVGGLVGIIDAGSVSNCVVNNSSVKSETADTYASGANTNAGGIAGRANSGSISGCQVKGTTTVLASYGEYSATVSAGALFGGLGQAELSGNTYEYTVTTTTKEYDLGKQQLVTNTNTDYYHRGIGGKEDGSTDVDGAVMYTQTVTVPGETPQASVTAEQDTYYSTAMISDALAYLVAPRQTVMLNVTSGEGYVINTFTATNTTTGIEIEAGSEEDNPRQYTFTMPDAPVTVAVTAAAAYGVTVAGVEVTELNYTDVLGDGKVSFTLPTQAVEPQTESTPATLTLNGATINGNIVSSLTTDLYIHLLGSNVINAGKESAFVSTTASSTQTLVFTTNATTPGQLLIKTSSNGYKENFYEAFGDGLTRAAASGKMLIAAAPTMTPTEGLYWTDQQFTVSGPSGSTLYYKNNINSEETAYTEPFTLAAGNYSLCAMRKVTVDETEFSLYGSRIGYAVHAKPAFSPQAGTYVGQQDITLTNLPISSPEAATYPQVWYYLGENVNDSVNISSAEQTIAVSKSTKVTVYILNENSGKVYKSAKVETEYTILSNMAEAYVEEVADATYTGSAIVPTVVVRANEKSEDNLTAGEDYTVSYMQGNNSVDEMIDAGDYSIVITGKGAYGGSQQVAFTITKAQAEVTTAPVAAEELAYTGEAQNLLSAAGVANFGTVVYSLASDGEFTATIPQATEVGKYNVYYKVLGTDNYDGTDAQSVAVTISKAVVTLAAANQSSTYTGDPVTYDETKITITPAALAEDRAISYTVSYNVPDPQNPEQTALTEDAPTAVGTYGVTISLVDEGGRYQAEAAQATLTITAAEATLAVAPQAQQNLVFNATPQELVTAGQTEDGIIQYKLSTDENWSTAIPTATNKGTYTVSYKVVGDANHNDTEPVDVEVTISAMTLTSEIVSLNQTGAAAIVYDGEAKTPAVTGYYATQKTDLVEGIDFTVAYTDNTNAGTAKATVTGQGNYTGSVELTFAIAKADFAGVEIADIADQPYNNGQAIEPAVTVTFNDIEVPASEYSVAYTANTAVGKATVTLTATGQANFVAGGTASTTFTIVNRTLAVGTDVAFADGQTWASYYTTTEDLELPEKVMAYIVTAVSETAATVAPISYVPKNVPVLLENNSTVTTENTDATGNLLAGTTEATAVAGLSGTVYGLHGNRFLKVTSGSIPAHRAYLVTGTEVVAPTGAPYLNIIFGDATAIDRVKADAGDGDGQWYTLDGRKLQQKPAKSGLYIKNGRKVVINNK